MAEYAAKLQDFKVDAVSALKQTFSGSNDFIFADYRGLSVQQITELRKQLREKGASFKVIKNRYAKIALNELEYPDVAELLVGPTAVTLTESDSGSAAKVLFDFGRETPVTVKGAIIDGNVFDSAQVEAYSKLPTRDELISMLMSAMNGPVTNLMYALQAVPQKLVRTLQAVADKKGSE
jgi:large subunit ribosomal protein L10